MEDNRTKVMALGYEVIGNLVSRVAVTVNDFNDTLVKCEIDELEEIKKYLTGERDTLIPKAHATIDDPEW